VDEAPFPPFSIVFNSRQNDAITKLLRPYAHWIVVFKCATRFGSSMAFPVVFNDKFGEDYSLWCTIGSNTFARLVEGNARKYASVSVRFGGMSLNDLLLQGPDLTNNVVGDLLRFRQEPTWFLPQMLGQCVHRVDAAQPSRKAFGTVGFSYIYNPCILLDGVAANDSVHCLSTPTTSHDGWSHACHATW